MRSSTEFKNVDRLYFNNVAVPAQPAGVPAQAVHYRIMDLSPSPRNFKPSAKAGPAFRDDVARATTAGAFTAGAQLYESVRPTYPQEVSKLLGGCRSFVDVGAGTGKLTGLLAEGERASYAIDPSADMIGVLKAAYPAVHAWRATAESTALRSCAVDAYVSAQTWHWVDTRCASAEAHRVVAAGGRLVLVWNTLDVSHPWVLRYSRISHSGDVHREGFYPDVDKPWRLTHELRMKWFDVVTTDDLLALAQTRSYWLRATLKTRSTVTENLHWYLFKRLGFDQGQLVPLPYRTDAFVYERD